MRVVPRLPVLFLLAMSATSTAVASSAATPTSRPIVSLERQLASGVQIPQFTNARMMVPPTTTDGVWSHLSISGRYGHIAVQDPAGDRMLVFGGIDGFIALNDLWELPMAHASPWEPVKTTGTPPPGDAFYAAILDIPRDRLVVVGGGSAWTLSLHGTSAWTGLDVTGTAPSFGGPGLFDAARDRLLILDEHENTLWALSLSGTPAWTRQTPTGTPPVERFGASMIYDPLRDRLVLFSGEWDAFPLPSDVWALSLSGTPAWTEVIATGERPEGRFDATAIYDVVHDRMVVYGGSDGFGHFRDAWALDLSGTPAWSPLDVPSRTPVGRVWHTAVYDEVRGRMVVFGGEDDEQPHERNDVWALSLSGDPAWTPLPGTTPEPRAWHSAVLDPVGHRMVVFGGRNLHNESMFFGSTDAWTLSLDKNPLWSELQPQGTPPPASEHHTVIYDPPRHRMLVFGGSLGSDVWALSLKGNPAWTQLTPEGTSAPAEGAVIYDSRRDRMLVFSGSGTTVWALSLAGKPAWAMLAPAGAPPTETGNGIYDAQRDRVLVFGDPNESAVWSLTLGGSPGWTRLLPLGATPAPRSQQTVTYDTARDRLVIFGGYDSVDHYALDDVWALSLNASPAWTELHPTGWPGLSRIGHTAVYDPHGDRMVVFGGEDFYIQFNDVRALTWGKTKTASSISRASTLQPAYPNPFNPSLTIPFDLANDGSATLAVFDVSGRLVKTLVDGWTSRGAHAVTWDGTSGSGELVSSGVYFCRLDAAGSTTVQKVVLLK